MSLDPCQRYAVVGGPDSTHAVVMPSLPERARDLKREHQGYFWCSAATGGCGGALIAHICTDRSSYFAHKPGADCASAASDAQARARSYAHLAIQVALKRHLEDLGHRVSLEHHVDGGRVDVHSSAGEERHVLEVQRSPLTLQEWRRRDALYRASATSVTWLWDERRRGEAEDTLAEHEVAFSVRLNDAGTVDIATLWRSDGHAWSGLHECRLDEHGLWTPHRQRAITATRAYNAQLAAEADEQRRALQERAAQRRAEDERAAQAAVAAREARRRAATRAAAALAKSDRHRLTYRRQVCPDLDGWVPTAGWSALMELPAELHDSTRHLTYWVARLVDRSPVTDLAWNDVPDPEGLQVAWLVRHGYIALSDDGLHWVRSHSRLADLRSGQPA